MTPLYFDFESVPDQSPGLLEQLIAEVPPPTLEVIEPQNKPETVAKKQERNQAKLANWEAHRFDEATQKWRDTAKKFTAAEIYCGSFAVGDSEVINIAPPEYLHNERQVLENFLMACNQAVIERSPGRRIALVGQNILGYDCPLLQVRCMMHGIRLPVWWPVLTKPYHPQIIDTLPLFLGGQKSAPVKGHGKMDFICDRLGIPVKGSEFDDQQVELKNGQIINAKDIDGSMVWDLVDSGHGHLVAHYCGGDVERTRAMFLRMNQTLGLIGSAGEVSSLDAYNQQAVDDVADQDAELNSQFD